MTAIPLDFVCPKCGITGAEMRAEEQRKEHVAALLKERAGYVQGGFADRVAAVDAQLTHYGHEQKAAK